MANLSRRRRDVLEPTTEPKHTAPPLDGEGDQRCIRRRGAVVDLAGIPAELLAHDAIRDSLLQRHPGESGAIRCYPQTPVHGPGQAVPTVRDGVPGRPPTIQGDLS